MKKKPISKIDPHIIEGVVITVSEGMYGHWGYRHWLKNFIDCMAKDDCVYSFRAGGQPRHSGLIYIYLCIGGKIRYRINFIESLGPAELTFADGRKMIAKAWLRGCGPIVRAPQKIERQGFQGFRYCEKLF